MKACPSCGSRNEERSVFCNDCGKRLPGGNSVDAVPGDMTGLADPATSSMHGATLPPLPMPLATPVAPPSAPTRTGSCPRCGYTFPAGGNISWCPGCGNLLEAPPSSRITTPPGEPQAAPAPGVPVPPGWTLILLKAGERTDRYPLRKPAMTLGRTVGDYLFPEDAFLSPLHARVLFRPPAFWIEDAGSRNGVYRRLREPTSLRGGDMVNLGGLVLRFESAGAGPRSTSLIPPPGDVRPFGSGRERVGGHLVRILQDGSDGPVFPLTPSRTIFGRKTGHFLFPEDQLLSRQHAQFYERDGRMWVEDLGSSNGTMVRIREAMALEDGTIFRMGDVTLEVSAP